MILKKKDSKEKKAQKNSLSQDALLLHILNIKAILDNWIDILGLKSKVGTVASLGNYRKAIFTFFVFTIEKLC